MLRGDDSRTPSNDGEMKDTLKDTYDWRKVNEKLQYLERWEPPPADQKNLFPLRCGEKDRFMSGIAQEGKI